MENQEHNMSIKEEHHGEGSAYLPQLQAELDSIDVSFTSAKSLLEAGKVFTSLYLGHSGLCYQFCALLNN